MMVFGSETRSGKPSNLAIAISLFLLEAIRSPIATQEVMLA